MTVPVCGMACDQSGGDRHHLRFEFKLMLPARPKTVRQLDSLPVAAYDFQRVTNTMNEPMSQSIDGDHRPYAIPCWLGICICSCPA